MNNRKHIDYCIGLSVALELLFIALFTVVCATHMGRDPEVAFSDYTYNRVAIMSIGYVFAITQVGFSFYHRVVRPEFILFNALKTSVYTMFVSSLFFLLAEIQIRHFTWLIVMTPVIMLIISCVRLLMRRHLRNSRRKGQYTSRVCLIGRYAGIKDLLNTISDLSHGFIICGYFNDCQDSNYPANIPYLGKETDFEQWEQNNKEKGIESLFFATNLQNMQFLKNVSSYCDNNLIHFYCTPLVKSVLRRNLHPTNMAETELFTLHREPLKALSSRLIKRSFDIIFSLTFLFTLFPFVLLIFGTWIKLTSPGPIFFRQKRSGIENKDFYCFKFRSMAVNKDADSKQATKGDSRITRVGEFMRKTSIDELPQFINVLLGDMSVVGPRPHMLKHTSEYSVLVDRYMVRHFIRPGITGWAQVTGFRGETNELWQMEERIKKDIWYIENWSFMLDIVIIYKTVANAIKGEENAY